MVEQLGPFKPVVLIHRYTEVAESAVSGRLEIDTPPFHQKPWIYFMVETMYQWYSITIFEF